MKVGWTKKSRAEVKAAREEQIQRNKAARKEAMREWNEKAGRPNLTFKETMAARHVEVEREKDRRVDERFDWDLPSRSRRST